MRKTFIASLVDLLIFSIPSSSAQDTSDPIIMRNDWISPYFILTYYHSKCAGQAQEAISTILQNASDTSSQGPWSVTHEANFSPDGNTRSYVSWAPYYWPACCEDLKENDATFKKRQGQLITEDNDGKGVSFPSSSKREVQLLAQNALGNGAVLPLHVATSSFTSTIKDAGAFQLAVNAQTCKPRPKGYESDPTLIYKNCVYIRRDGFRNPDVRNLKCASVMVQMTRAVVVNALAYGLTRDEIFAQRAIRYIRVFFLDATSGVLPHNNYGQIIRGPPGAGINGENDWSKGTFRGSIEWRYMLQVINAVVIIRACGSKSWSTLDAAQMSKWASDYLHWLETSPLSLQAKNNGNNMSSFWYNQVIALYILLGKTEEATNQANAYFTGPFMQQIDSEGNQPLEATRVKSLHYLIFGLEGMMANAKLADNLGLNMWSARTTNGTTLQDAVDYIVNKINIETASDPKQSLVDKVDIADFAAHVSAALTAYGDRADGRYRKFLSDDDLTQDPEKKHNWRLYNLPCSFYSSPSKGHTVSSQTFH